MTPTLNKDGKIWAPVGGKPVLREGYSGYVALAYTSGRYYDPEMRLETVISELTEIRDLYKDRYTDMAVSARRDCGCRYDCHCSPTYFIYGWRDPEEIETKYIADAKAKAEADQEARDRAEYERLQRKLGVDVLT